MRLAKYLPEPIKQIIKSSFVYKLYLRRDLVKFPYAMNIELTNRCNLKCWMCPRPRMKNLKVGDIDFGLFKKIVDDMAKLADKRTKFALTGLGEPLRYNKMSNAIEYVKMKCQKAPIHIDTNATLLDEEKSEMLCRLLGGDWLLFSLNAGTQDTYESLMGADKFDLVVSDIKNFLAMKSERYPCLSLWIAIVIDIEGNVYPCCEALSTRENSELLLGNIREKSLIEIYSDKIKNIREKHLNSQWNDIPECSRCDFWSFSQNIWFNFNKRWF